jgi:peptide/nickel transport system substrate-binding protein
VSVSRRKFLRLSAASASGYLLLGRGAPAAEQPRRGGTIILGTPTEPPTLTSALNSQTDGGVSGKVFESLIALDARSQPVPALATSWSVANDGLAVTLQLRRGVSWHDGEPFTSADVAFSIVKIWKVYPSRGRATYANVVSVDTPDAFTAVIRLSKPAPYLLAALSSWDARVLPAHVYAKGEVLTNPHNNAPVGTGPFRFVRWERGSHILLERNPKYWDAPRPYVDQIVIRFMGDASAAAAALETGQIHITDGIAPADIGRLRANAQIVMLRPELSQQAGIIAVEFNLDRQVFRDVRVRRAIAHAIDRKFIADSIWMGNVTVADSPFPADLADFHVADAPQYPFDPKRAEALLDEAGLKRDAQGVRFSIFNDPLQIGATPNVLTAQYMRSTLNRIGVRLQVRTQDFGEYVNRVYTRRDFDTTISSNTASPDPAIAIQRLYWSQAYHIGVSFSNAMHYQSPEADRLLEAAQVELEPARRRDLYGQFQRVAQTDLPRIPLVVTHPNVLARRAVRNIEQSSYGVNGSFADLSLGA